MTLMDTAISAPAEGWTARVDEVTEPEWNSLLDGFADASFYQTWAYGAVSWGERQLSHLVLYRSGEPMALAQLRVVRLPLLGCGVAYLRWGPVCIPRGHMWSADVFCAMVQAINREYVSRRRLLLRILPQTFQQDDHGPGVESSFHAAGLKSEVGASSYRTLRVDLSPTCETIRKRLDQKWRNQLNGAERNNLTVVEGTDDALYGRFLQLYDEMMARKRFDTSVDPGDFRRMQQMLPERQKMLIMLSEKDGRPLTALVASVVGATGIYLLGATSNEGMKTKGSYLLQWRMMQRLKERGCRWYDLGGINPATNPGVYHFKQGMGGEEVLQLPRLALSGGRLSSLTVSGGERIAAAVRSFKARNQTRATEAESSSVPAAAPAQ